MPRKSVPKKDIYKAKAPKAPKWKKDGLSLSERKAAKSKPKPKPKKKGK